MVPYIMHSDLGRGGRRVTQSGALLAYPRMSGDARLEPIEYFLQHDIALTRRIGGFPVNREISLCGVLILQALAIYWLPASQIFGTVALTWQDLSLAVAVASSILFLDEGRKLIVRLWRR